MTDSSTINAIFRLMRSLKCHLDRDLDALGLGLVPMQVRVLMTIHGQAQCTANDIVNVIQRDKAQITRLINGLIEQGLILKEPNPCDKRSQLLVFTERGQYVQNLLLEHLEASQKKMAAGLSQQELEQFESLAAKLASNLEAK
ncbi:MarR family winged helix-turn-helix transcriptional regulator [Agaribacterium sp. ZY112]|uniref:MarR family winged helix-turn-helix transcriptional regulator n=1 Tax=Agaribacterium sp. ZY112 TaxID=3233574 RepID=UPI003523B192